MVQPMSNPLDVVAFIASDQVGSGDPELGGVLMRALIKTLPGLSPPPRKVLLMNAGVKLAAEGSPVLDGLRALAEAGVEVHSCGTCLDYFHLEDKLAVGQVGNMHDILQAIVDADRVIRP